MSLLHRHRFETKWRFAPDPRPGKWHGVWTYHRVDTCRCGRQMVGEREHRLEVRV